MGGGGFQTGLLHWEPPQQWLRWIRAALSPPLLQGPHHTSPQECRRSLAPGLARSPGSACPHPAAKPSSSHQGEHICQLLLPVLFSEPLPATPARLTRVTSAPCKPLTSRGLKATGRSVFPGHSPGLVETSNLWATGCTREGLKAPSWPPNAPSQLSPEPPQQPGQLRPVGRGLLGGRSHQIPLGWAAQPSPLPVFQEDGSWAPASLCSAPSGLVLQPASCPCSLRQKRAEASEPLHQPVHSEPQPPLPALSCSGRTVQCQQDRPSPLSSGTKGQSPWGGGGVGPEPAGEGRLLDQPCGGLGGWAWPAQG